MQLYNFARGFATAAHINQKRASGDDYIIHPIAVASLLQGNPDDTLTIAALLHDVVEDTSITQEQIEATFPPSVANLVKELTDVYTSSNFPSLGSNQRWERELQRRATMSPDAQTIKYADIIDNCRGIRHLEVDAATLWLNKTAATLIKLNKGDNDLRMVAAAAFDEAVASVRFRIETTSC